MREIEMGMNSLNTINGRQISVEGPIHVQRAEPGDTALHEAKHVVAALENGTGVVRATIIPGPGYGGLTELTKADPVAAAAPHSTGHLGTGWDVHLVELMGHDITSIGKVSRRIVENNSDKVEAVASVLEEKGTIGSFDIKEAIREVDYPREENVTVRVENQQGEEILFAEIPSRQGKVMIPGEWVYL